MSGRRRFAAGCVPMPNGPADRPIRPLLLTEPGAREPDQRRRFTDVRASRERLLDQRCHARVLERRPPRVDGLRSREHSIRTLNAADGDGGMGLMSVPVTLQAVVATNIAPIAACARRITIGRHFRLAR